MSVRHLHRERLVAAAGDAFTAGDVARLLRPAADRITDERWSDADVALLDEADALINGVDRVYGHVVVDEAQDLSPMQLRSVKRRSNGSLTIVGDLAQYTGPWARDSWDEVVHALAAEHPAEVRELELGYRVPEQVYAFASRLLPYAAPAVNPPRVVREGPAEPALMRVAYDHLAVEAVTAAREHAGRGLFVGVVCPHQLRGAVVDALRTEQVQYSDTSEGKLGSSINLCSPEEAKGLEFDAVVVVEPAVIAAGGARGLRLLYVALTRTTQYLTVVHSGVELPIPQEDPENSVTVATVRDIPPLAVRPHPGTAAPPGDAQSPMHAMGHQAAGPNLAETVIAAVAGSLAAEVRANVPPALWPVIVDRLRRDLDVRDDDLFDLFD